MKSIYTKSILFLLFLTLIISNDMKSQDIHFSHIHASPTFLNPAYTGVHNGTIRVIMNYKSQWSNIGKYNTAALSADFKVASFRNKDFFSMGFGSYFDNAGDLNYRTCMGTLAMSYTKSLSDRRNNGLTLGLTVAVMNMSYDFSKAVGLDYEPTAGLYKNSVMNYSVGAGVSWFTQVGRYSSFYAGFAANHLNRPNISTMEASSKLPMKMTANVGGIFSGRSRHALLPSAMFINQGKQQEINTGTFYRFELNKGWNQQNNFLYLGAWARWHVIPKSFSGMDAVILSLRYDTKGWNFTFSYDVNVSQLAKATLGNGGPELSIIYTRGAKKSKSNKVIYCPKF
jgi:type IX secretion system PorP/SprF family membrane protein